VEAKGLFYNVPPRLKFLKTESTELSHCVEVVTRYALSFPGVEFVLAHNGRQVLRAEKNAGILERITSFFGKEVGEALMPVDREELGVRIKGYLGKPDIGRKDMRRSYLFLNGRYVKDRAVHAALRRSYREVMPEKFHPVYFLQLGMPPDWVDVNVHPTKIEVRFLDGARIFSAVFKVASETLAGEERCAAAAAPATGLYTGWRPRKPSAAYPFAGESSYAGAHGAGVTERALPFGTPPVERAGGLEPEGGAPRVPAEEGGLPAGRILQVHDTYAVYEMPSGIGILDQHALHERLLYEKLKSEYEAGGIRLQKLLMPVVIDLEPSKASRAEEICFDLNHLGIRAEPFGLSALKISAIPALLKDVDPHGLVMEVIDRVAGGGMGEEAYRGLLHRLACRAAVKAGKSLTEEELRALFESGAGVDYSGRCPHGRPTTVVLTLKELEEMFKRRGF
jgi:DNA mismatch repair protein MutL